MQTSTRTDKPVVSEKPDEMKKPEEPEPAQLQGQGYPFDKEAAEAALKKQQMYINHCLKIVQAFYNYIEKGLHYSNWAEFEICIKKICKQSHSKKITGMQYKNTAGNVEE
eukprot:m51a1_g8934 hypothetical protein (110) ;mRNA; f:890067-894246